MFDDSRGWKNARNLTHAVLLLHVSNTSVMRICFKFWTCSSGKASCKRGGHVRVALPPPIILSKVMKLSIDFAAARIVPFSISASKWCSSSFFERKRGSGFSRALLMKSCSSSPDYSGLFGIWNTNLFVLPVRRCRDL